MAGTDTISFMTSELRNAPAGAFLTGFTDAVSQATAGEVVAWARSAGLRFRHSKGKARLVEYIVVPDAPYPGSGTLGEPIMTLQQRNSSGGSWDIPFGRMRGLGFRDSASKGMLLKALNRALPSKHQLNPKGLESGYDRRSWAELPYEALRDSTDRAKVLAVLQSVVRTARAGIPPLSL